MATPHPKTTEYESPDDVEDPGRTPGRAEGDDFEIEDCPGGICGPQAIEQEMPCCEEPKRTPGKAEG